MANVSASGRHYPCLPCYRDRWWKPVYWLLVGILAVAGAPRLPAPARAGALPTWGFVVTYDPASRQSLLDHLDQVDVVVPDYFQIRPNGTLASTAEPSLDLALRRAGKPELPLVQNSIAFEALHPWLAETGRRSVLIGRLVAAATGYAGLTLDLEGVSPEDRAALTAFLGSLAASLHVRGQELAVTVPAETGDLAAGWGGAYDDAAIAARADHVIVMAYAYRTALSQPPGPISPLPWVRQVLAYARSVVPADRLVLGIGVWGYDWNLSEGGRAVGDRYAQIADLVQQTHGVLQRDRGAAAVEYTYTRAGASHQVWFEDAATVGQKVALATASGLAGVALWRLGEEAPGVWTVLRTAGQPDFPVPHGWFFTQTGENSGLGYTVVDDRQASFWTAFRQLGGVPLLGYPVSQAFVGKDGLVYQVFQRGILQWRPDQQTAELANTFELLTAAGADATLAQAGIPPPIADDGSEGDWQRARQIRLSWLTNPAIARAFAADPNPAALPGWTLDRAIQLYGLPASRPVASGPFVVQRFQRISLQLWVQSVPGMPPAGSVVGILGGDYLKSAGWVPAAAAAPQAPP
jgi:spore germination protein